MDTQEKEKGTPTRIMAEIEGISTRKSKSDMQRKRDFQTKKAVG